MSDRNRSDLPNIGQRTPRERGDLMAFAQEMPSPTPVQLAIVDYGMGNRRSVEKALRHIGAHVTVSDDVDRLRAAAGLVVPGVGAFPHGMQRLRALGLDTLLRERVQRGIPVLGICLGMQLAFERSTEHDGAQGLGLIPGEVRQLEHGSLKLPHIGWNEVELVRRSPLIEGLPQTCAFYHVHSYAPCPSHSEDVVATATYGAQFTSIVAIGSFYGVQFHPEKSSSAGLRLLANFARLCSRAALPVAS